MKKNKLIVLGGFAGSGKTTIAKKLATNYNYPFFSSDDFNAGLMPILKESFHEVAPFAHELTRHILKKNLEAGVTCVHDLNMCHQKMWDLLDETKKELINIEFVTILLICSLETHKERIKRRGENNKIHLNLGGDKLEDSLHKYDFIEKLERDDVIRINANGSIEDVYEKVLDVLNLN